MREVDRTTSLLVAALLSCAGCDVATGACQDDLEGEVVTFSGGQAEDGLYLSSSWEPEDRLEFPPGLTIRLEHGLGVVPRAWQAYVSSAREGQGSELVSASGNQAELVSIDEVAIELHNGTCSDLYLVVAAQAPAP